MIKLKAPVNTGNRYCGPAVISALANIGTAEAAAVIRSVTHQRSVRGTSYYGCTEALRRLGFSTVGLQVDGKPTLAGWLKASKSIRTAGRVFLVCAGSHFLLISGRRYVCGIVKDVVSVRDKRVKRRARVAKVWEVSNDLVATYAPPVSTSVGNPMRSKAVALAKKLGVELEAHWNNEPGREPEYWVYPPEGISDENGNDPFDDHLAFGWTDILGRVRGYEKALGELKA